MDLSRQNAEAEVKQVLIQLLRGHFQIKKIRYTLEREKRHK